MGSLFIGQIGQVEPDIVPLAPQTACAENVLTEGSAPLQNMHLNSRNRISAMADLLLFMQYL
jgi:hypothetical protein